MRWMAWNALGGVLWLAGLVYAKGTAIIGSSVAGDGEHVLAGLMIGVVGLALLMWVNLVDPA